MSRIGKQPIPLPKDVKVQLAGSRITVQGPKGKLERQLLDVVDVRQEGEQLIVEARDGSKRTNAFRGMTRSLVNNMVLGVSQGFKRTLVVEGVGYRAAVSGNTLNLNVGYSQQVDFVLPAGVSAKVDRNQIILESIDKELLGQTAARIRAVRKPEPYKGKGIRYEDEHIVRKVGKAAGKK